MIPKISAICPTYNRRVFIPQAIAYFLRQDYLNRELLIIDDGTDKIIDLIPHDPSIRYISISEQCSIGMKRNLACSLAQGEIISFWDDDDWYSPHRLSQQAQPILDGKADVTGLQMDIVLNLSTGEAWRCGSDALHREVFINDVHTGTLMYRKELWGKAYYPNKSIGEDADFLATLIAQGARLVKIPNNGDFVYIRSGQNTWPLPPMQYPHMHDWQQVPLDEYMPEDDRRFYKGLVAVAV